MKDRKNIIILGLTIFVISVIVIVYIVNRQKKSYVNIESFSVENEVQLDKVNSGNNVNNDGKNVVEEYDVIYIHIVGEVNVQGLIELRAGSRIADAIEVAGGITQYADLSKINLACILSDGQKLVIPRVGENVEQYLIDGDGNGNSNSGSKVLGKSTRVNINAASQSELEILPGIGASTALKIIEYREKNGGFKSIEDLKNVSGIGNSKFEALKEYIVVK